jgi:hypothetical protein
MYRCLDTNIQWRFFQMSNRTIDPGVSIKTYDILNFVSRLSSDRSRFIPCILKDMKKLRSRSSNVVSALTTSQVRRSSLVDHADRIYSLAHPRDCDQR